MPTADKPASNIILRASGFPSNQDCERSWAAKLATDPTSNFGPIAAAAGFTFEKEKRDNAGSAIGTACHEGFGQMWQAKIDGYELPNPEQVALSKFRRLDVQYDEGSRATTPDQTTAEEQIRRQVRAYLPHAKSLDPMKVEFKLETEQYGKSPEIVNGKLTWHPDEHKPYVISGHPDILEKNGNIRDMKFGRTLSPYDAQLGTYRLMARSHGIEAKGLFVDWVPRRSVGPKSSLPVLEVIPYNARSAENAAHYTIESAIESIEKFKETGNPWAFKPRPQSLLCSKKWCLAWGTPFCDMGRPE